MRFLTCATVLAAIIFAAHGFPADLTDPEQPRKNPNNKPTTGGAVEKPRPTHNMSKPSPQDNLQNSQSPNTFIMDVAQSTVMSELPGEAPIQIAAEVVVHDPILEVGSEIHAPEYVVQDAIPEVQLPEVHLAAPAVAPAVESGLLASEIVNASAAESPEIDSGAQATVVDTELLLETPIVQVSLSNSGKSRRHAGVEAPSVLRIGDFEDVENGDMLAPEYPSIQEQMGMVQEFSKEEMIIMAMDQMHKNRPQMSINAPRPAAHRPNLIKPQHTTSFAEEDDDEANESTVDLRNSGEPATIVQEVVAPVNLPTSASKPQVSKDTSSASGIPSQSQHSSHVHHPYGSSSKNKPRPYGMDRPSKNRPTLDSGSKNEHFGLPHSSASNDYIQKGELGHGGSGSSSSSSSTSYLGFQIPTIKWTSFSDLFPTFWGSQSMSGMLKSDHEVTACVDDDEEVVNEGIRSPVIQSGSMCSSTEVKNSCSSTCVDHGFSSGSCLGPYPTPGCLCRHRSSEEYGLMLKPLQDMVQILESNREETLSVSAPCKKCACIDSCKQSGSFTGFCTDRCYCAVPWSMKKP